MRVEPAIASRYVEQAVVEQLSEDMRGEGYAVEREAALDGLKADLVARRGRETIVFQLKTPGSNEPGEPAAAWARRTAELRAHACRLGASFRLILVRPPRETRVEIAGLETALEVALRREPPKGLHAIAASAAIGRVSDISIESLVLRGDLAQVDGEAVVDVTVLGDEGSVLSTESLPLTFEAVLDRSDRVTELRRAEVDTSSWSWDEDTPGSPADGDGAGSRVTGTS